jgi:hypothetical protein
MGVVGLSLPTFVAPRLDRGAYQPGTRDRLPGPVGPPLEAGDDARRRGSP